MIRKSITHEELETALQPLYELLGVKSNYLLYANPPLTIGGPAGRRVDVMGHVSFAHVVPKDEAAFDDERPEGTATPWRLQEDDPLAEVMQYVTVEVIQ